ncbi:hypothetical protein ACWEV3_33925 [Saccharopolyspora sp. NPDC003752]
MITSYCKPIDDSKLPECKEELNSAHKSVRARVEHTLAHMKCLERCAQFGRHARQIRLKVEVVDVGPGKLRPSTA